MDGKLRTAKRRGMERYTLYISLSPALPPPPFQLGATSGGWPHRQRCTPLASHYVY